MLVYQYGVRHKSLFRRAVNRICAKLAQALPGSTTVRPILHRLRGVNIRGTVFVGDDVYIENEYPECVTIDDGVQIGLRSTLIAHTRGSGRITIGQDAFIGASCVIVAAEGVTLTIGSGAVISAGSVITSDVPPNTLVAPERVRAYAQVTVPLSMTTTYQEFRRGLRPLHGRSDQPVPVTNGDCEGV